MIVRSVLVTAINLDLGGKIWWPSKLDTRAGRGRSEARPSRSGSQVTVLTDRSVGRGTAPAHAQLA